MSARIAYCGGGGVTTLDAAPRESFYMFVFVRVWVERMLKGVLGKPAKAPETTAISETMRSRQLRPVMRLQTRTLVLCC